MDTVTTTTGIPLPGPLTAGRFATSPALDQLATDFALAQAEMVGALKSSTNPFYHSEYADLSSVWKACRGPLTSHGLSVVQLPVTAGDGQSVALVTLLLHKSGQWIRSECSATPKDSGAQAMGSVMTYLRRYALAGVGIPQVDDDGEAGEHTRTPPQVSPVTKTKTPPPVATRPVPTSAVSGAASMGWPDSDLEPGSLDGPGLDDSGVLVTAFTRAVSKPGAAKIWSAGFVTLSDGSEGGSFDEEVIKTLERAFHTQQPVVYSSEPSKRDPKKINILAASFANSVSF